MRMIIDNAKNLQSALTRPRSCAWRYYYNPWGLAEISFPGPYLFFSSAAWTIPLAMILSFHAQLCRNLQVLPCASWGLLKEAMGFLSYDRWKNYKGRDLRSLMKTQKTTVQKYNFQKKLCCVGGRVGEAWKFCFVKWTGVPQGDFHYWEKPYLYTWKITILFHACLR